MNKEEFKKAITDIGSLEDVALIRAKLGELQETMSNEFDNYDSTRTERDQLKEDNEQIRQANMKLFLQVGGKKEEDKTPTPTNEDLKYEDLFDDKGGLK